MDKKIKSIVLFFHNSEDCSQIEYKVGKNGVTKIEQCHYYPAEYCIIPFYEIYNEDKIIAKMYHVSLVEYF